MKIHPETNIIPTFLLKLVSYTALAIQFSNEIFKAREEWGYLRSTREVGSSFGVARRLEGVGGAVLVLLKTKRVTFD